MSWTRQQKQKYSIATLLCNNNLNAVMKQLWENEYLTIQEKKHWADFTVKINKYYKKRDGYVPPAVIRIVNGEKK